MFHITPIRQFLINLLNDLSKTEKSLLCKGLNFATPPDKHECSDYLLPFELLYRALRKIP